MIHDNIFGTLESASDMFGETIKSIGPSGGNYWENLWGGIQEGIRGFDWGGLAKIMAPPLAGAGVEALAQVAFPGERGKVLSVDPRTTEGRQAEQLRLQGAQRMSASLDDPFAGLSPEELYDITSSSRSADAARGALETGGSALRETRARREAIEGRRQSNLGQLQALTSGYAGEQTLQVAGQESPWAKLMRGLSPAVVKALEEYLKQRDPSVSAPTGAMMEP